MYLLSVKFRHVLQLCSPVHMLDVLVRRARAALWAFAKALLSVAVSGRLVGPCRGASARPRRKCIPLGRRGTSFATAVSGTAGGAAAARAPIAAAPRCQLIPPGGARHDRQSPAAGGRGLGAISARGKRLLCHYRAARVLWPRGRALVAGAAAWLGHACMARPCLCRCASLQRVHHADAAFCQRSIMPTPTRTCCHSTADRQPRVLPCKQKVRPWQ